MLNVDGKRVSFVGKAAWERQAIDGFNAVKCRQQKSYNSRSMEEEIKEYVSQQKEKEVIVQHQGQHPSMMIHPQASSPSDVCHLYGKAKPSMASERQAGGRDKLEEAIFDRFIKLKSEDKPKDTLALIQFKKRQVLEYLSIHCSTQTPKNAVTTEENNPKTSQLFKKIYHNTVCKSIPANSLLLTSIKPSVDNRCDMVTRLNGEVVCYFPEVFLIKKNQKILKIASKYPEGRHLILDYCFQEWEKKYFSGIYRHCPSINYFIHHAPPEKLQMVTSELADRISSDKLQCRFQKDFIKIISRSSQDSDLVSSEFTQSLINQLKEEEQFLLQFRGEKNPGEVNLEIDLLAVNLWRAGGDKGCSIANKIIKIYNMKKEEIESTIAPIKDSNNFHIPFNMPKEQNCAMCPTIRPTSKPRRTCTICKLCSSQKEKPLYLCRSCFGSYHENPDIPIFKKNEKKTKKVMQDHKKKYKQIKKEEKQESEPKAEDLQRKREKLLRKLDRQTDEYFDKLEQMINQGDSEQMQACEYFCNMLLNQNIHTLHLLSQGQVPTDGMMEEENT